MISRVLVHSLCFALALSKPLMRDSTMLVHESRETVPSGFTLQGPAALDSMLDLRVALVGSNSSGLEAALYDVSTPGSANYGKYLTKEQVHYNVLVT